MENGADIAFVESPRDMEELAAVPKRVNGPCLINVVVGGVTPDVNLRDAEKMGFRLAIMPSMLISTIFNACDQVLEELNQTDQPPTSKGVMTVGQRFNRFHGEYWNGLRTKFQDPPAS